MWQAYLAVVLFGGFGCLARMLIAVWCLEKFGPAFPYGTLAVNLLGSFLIGIFGALTRPETGWTMPPLMREGVMIGLLGGLTTFSSFALQTMTLLQEGRWPVAGLNVLVSVTGCLLVVAVGYWLTTLIVRG